MYRRVYNNNNKGPIRFDNYTIVIAHAGDQGFMAVSKQSLNLNVVFFSLSSDSANKTPFITSNLRLAQTFYMTFLLI